MPPSAHAKPHLPPSEQTPSHPRGNRLPTLCLVSGATSLQACLQAIGRARDQALQGPFPLQPEQIMAECRIDQLEAMRPNDIQQLATVLPLQQWIITTRLPQEGGQRWMSLKERQAFWSQAFQWAVGVVDIELATLEQHPKLGEWLAGQQKPSTRLLVSFHDTEGVPDEQSLQKHWVLAKQWGAWLLKWVCTPRSTEEEARLLHGLQQFPFDPKLPLLALTMGFQGQWLRWLQPRFSKLHPMLYVKTDAMGTAPGQASLDELLAHGRYMHQQSHWPIYGVVGAPVHHSLSPQLHHQALMAADLPGLWLRCHVEGPLAPWLHQVARPLGVAGLAVTMPHKQEAMALAQSHDFWAEQIGAVNTLQWQGESGGWRGYNTDGPAILALLLHHLALPHLQEQVILILGTGGAARAAAAAVAHAGGKPVIGGRNLVGAQQLAAAFGGEAMTLEQIGESKEVCAAMVQCTSAGMGPQAHISPLPLERLPPVQVLLETIYHPPTTLLMQAYAQQRPQTLIVPGTALLLEQAMVQFTLLTGHGPNRAGMEQALEQARLS